MFVLILQIYSYIQIKKKMYLSSSKVAWRENISGTNYSENAPN